MLTADIYPLSIIVAAVKWLNYWRYRVKPETINQSIIMIIRCERTERTPRLFEVELTG